MSRHTTPCPECDATTPPIRESRVANPWGWLCLVAGGVLLLLGLCAWPVTILSVALAVVGPSLRQVVTYCGECGHVLHSGPTRLGVPSGRLLGVAAALLLLNLLVGLFAAAALYSRYMTMLNQF